MENIYEENLIKAGERLGKAMMKCSEKEKEILRELKKKVEEYAKEQEERGKFLDKSSLFAAAIIVTTEIENEELIEAAKEYIEMDYLFVKSLEDLGIK